MERRRSWFCCTKTVGISENEPNNIIECVQHKIMCSSALSLSFSVFFLWSLLQHTSLMHSCRLQREWLRLHINTTRILTLNSFMSNARSNTFNFTNKFNWKLEHFTVQFSWGSMWVDSCSEENVISLVWNFCTSSLFLIQRVKLKIFAWKSAKVIAKSC